MTHKSAFMFYVLDLKLQFDSLLTDKMVILIRKKIIIRNEWKIFIHTYIIKLYLIALNEEFCADS